MSAGADKTVTFSFMGLDTLMKSFDDPSSLGVKADLMYQLAGELGELAVPCLLRKLCASDESAWWAAELLLHLSGSAELATRVTRDLEDLCADGSIPDQVKIRAAGLLSTLNENWDFLPILANPEATAEHSFDELAQCLTSPSEVAQAADLLISDMLSPNQLVSFVEELATKQAKAAGLLASEFVSRGDLGVAPRQALWYLCAQHGDWDDSPPAQQSTFIARHESGRAAIISFRPIDNLCRPHFRAVSVLLSAQGQFQQCEYLDHATQTEMDQWLLQPLLDHDYQLEAVTMTEARQFVVSGLRLRDESSTQLGSDYYLGRDLLGLRHEHQSDLDRRSIASSDRLARRIGMARVAR